MNRNFAGPARIVNLLLGIWLFFSAFAWPHESRQQVVTCIFGILVAVIGFLAVRLSSGIRFANTVLAVLLFASAFVLHHAAVTTVWNNSFVAVVIFLVSLIGPTHETVAPTQHAEASLPAAERGFPPPQNPRTA
jgi:hypothetical protein